jgi:SpoIID/LytB domain protein
MAEPLPPSSPSGHWRLATLLIALAVAALTLTASCATRRHGGDTADSGPSSPPPWEGGPAPTPAPQPSGPIAPAGPRISLDSEPTIGVFLCAGGSVQFSTLVPGRAGGSTIAAGSHTIQPGAGGVRLDGLTLPNDSVIELADAGGGARFSAELDPPTGAPQRLKFAGQPFLHVAGGRIELIERVPLETYLAGVVPTEMIPSWPRAALEAQAVAARSYAAAKIVARSGLPWQLHWHYTVDMAYAGLSPRANATVHQALANTRGWMLQNGGAPVPALFHACSGGRTESAANVFSEMLGNLGMAASASAMPVVDDPAAEGGAAGLGMTATHWRWKATIPLADISSGLAGWAREHPDRRFTAGTVVDVRTAGHFGDSGRVSEVAIREKVNGREVTVRLPASDFRMAVGPGIIRSTWWDRCVMATGHGGALVLAGRGFGHGVGLSQVSAWRMAQQGSSAEEILARFYPGSALVRRYP